ncbi:MAG: DoxX family membrane protein [Patescibacteria group bacterium]
MKENIITFAAAGLRFVLGWFMFFAGIEKVLDPNWTASGFLAGAKTFPAFYAWFASPAQSVWVDPLNAWGITLVGVALLIGVSVRPAALAGALLMIIYYFPHVAYPFVIPHGFIVEEHIIYAVAFVLVAYLPAARAFGLSRLLRQTFLARVPLIRALI